MIAQAPCSRNVMAQISDIKNAGAGVEVAHHLPEICEVNPEHCSNDLRAIAAPIAGTQLVRCAIAPSARFSRDVDLVRLDSAPRLLAIAAAAQRTRCAIAHPDVPRPDGELGLVRALALMLRLSPTRWHAKRLVRQIVGKRWVWGRVVGTTTPQPLHNQHAIEITALFGRLCRLRPGASRVMRMCPHADARACRGVEKTTTPLPLIFIYSYQLVVGCEAVAGWLCSTTTGAICLETGGFLRFSNILAGAYAAAGSIGAADVARSTVQGSRAGETFGVSVAGAGLDLLGLAPIGDELDQAEVLGRNGGFLRASRGGCEPVGRAMLEGWPQGRGNPCVARLGRKPVGLARRLGLGALVDQGRTPAALGDRPEAPPYAPIRRRRFPEHAGPRASRNLDWLRADPIPGTMPAGAERRQTLNGTIGSGSGDVPGEFAAAMGLGGGAVRIGLGPVGLRRGADVTRERVRVN